MISAALIFFLIALVLEASVTTLPLVLITVLVFSIIVRREWVFAVALILGLILDAATFKTLGSSSIFFVTFIFLVILYKRKFEISTKPFIFIACFLGSILYLQIFKLQDFLFLQALTSAILGTIIFIFLKKLNRKKVTNFKFYE